MKDINWNLFLESSPTKVYDFINSDEGRKAFWAESAVENNGIIHFKFINGWKYQSAIIERNRPFKFVIDYFEMAVTITLEPHESGTILKLHNSEISDDDEFHEVHAGWVSVLLTLKAAVDFDVDLRNHNSKYCWDQGFVDN